MKSLIFKIYSNFYNNYVTKISIFWGLTFAHLITSIYWLNGKNWLSFGLENNKVYCYPILKNCFKFSAENTNYIKYIFVFYFLASVILLILFFFKKFNKYIYPVFIALTLLKAILLLSRYNFMGNYHTMHLSLCIISIISFGNINLYRITLILQYFFAGLLKLNTEWMSGASLIKYGNYLFPGFWNQLSLAYVPVLELLLIWGLLSKNKFIRIITLTQLVMFHLYSILIVGLYYPLIMTGLLIPVIYYEFKEDTIVSQDYIKLNLRNIISVAVIILIITWNISTKFYALDPSKDGYIRYLSLNMLDAKLKCQSSLFEETKSGDIIGLNIPKLATSYRIHCDPLVFDTFLRRLCIKNPERKFMFYLESARTTETNYTLIRAYKNVCQEL
jgi:hypothetical protein